jgi:hypothetical protein
MPFHLQKNCHEFRQGKPILSQPLRVDFFIRKSGLPLYDLANEITGNEVSENYGLITP